MTFNPLDHYLQSHNEAPTRPAQPRRSLWDWAAYHARAGWLFTALLALLLALWVAWWTHGLAQQTLREVGL